MEKYLSSNFHIWKIAYHRVFIQFPVRMELYESFHIYKLYDKKFWSTRKDWNVKSTQPSLQTSEVKYA